MSKLLELYEGKLTYTMAALAIAGGVAGFYFGYLDKKEAMELVWAGLVVFGLRRAI